MKRTAIQDTYSEMVSHCYGCGRLNDEGLQIKSFWDGKSSICQFRPLAHHTAFPGYVYGGLIASLIDCHGTGTAAAAAYQDAGREMGSEPELRFVTGSLEVKYLRPTPIDATLVLHGTVREIKGKKVVVDIDLHAKDEICAKGTVVAIQAPDKLIEQLTSVARGSKSD